METHEKVFFNILRSALWGPPVEVSEGFSQWSSIMRLAKSQALMGLVGEVMLTRREIRDSLPAKSVERLQGILLTSIGVHRQMNITLQMLVTKLRDYGVEPVLLKGQGLARNYPTPELRQCGDIDIYVGVENYEKAYDAIEHVASWIAEKSRIWKWMHFDAKIGPVMVEVHQIADKMYSRKSEKLYREFMLDGLSKNLCPIRFGDVEVMTPNDTYNAFYVFYHLWRHFSTSGVGLRQFCDWASFLHTHVGKLDLLYLKKMLDDLGFMKPWQVFGCFLVKDLGLPEEEFPLYNRKYVGKVEGVREYVLTDGNFGVNVGFERAHRNGYLHGKWVSLKYHVLRFFRMFAIFPEHTMLRFWYMLRDGFAQVFKDIRIKKES